MSKQSKDTPNTPKSDFKGATSDFTGILEEIPTNPQNVIYDPLDGTETVIYPISEPTTEDIPTTEEPKHYDLKRNGKELYKTDIPYVYRLADGTGFVCRIYCKKPKVDTFVMKDPETKVKGKKGKPFATKKAAHEYLVKQKEIILNDSTYKNREITFGEVWEMFLSSPHEKANETIRRYNSIYNHHVKPVFGDRVIKSIPTEDYNEYLKDMYNKGDGNGKGLNGYSFQYVESILKFIFLVVNYAYKKHIITTDNLTRFEKELEMPGKKKASDDKAIRVLTDEQIIKIKALLENTDFYIPFLISLTGGLRPAETFALCFNDIDYDKCTVSITKQMVEETTGKRIIKQPKTKKSTRIVELPPETIRAIQAKQRALQRAREEDPILFEQNKSRFIDGRDNKEIVIEQPDFISVDMKGRYITAHSFSYYTKIIKRDICPNLPDKEDFSFYTFRKTHLSLMAANNCPVGELMKRVGHSKPETLYTYYFNKTDYSDKIMKSALKQTSSIIF